MDTYTIPLQSPCGVNLDLTGQAGCFYPGTPVSSTNKTKILLKVALDTINQPYSNGQKQTNTLNNIGTEINT
jgi:hypothetical protein